MRRTVGLAVAIAIATPVTAVLAAPGSGGPQARAADRDCSDFANQRDAQAYYRDRGGPGSDPDRLDADDNGRACESLPCPCADDEGTAPPRPRPEAPRRADFPGAVVRVVDGDTLVVRSRSGRRHKVRLIGIDTPEVFGGVECGGQGASASMKRLARPGRRVRVTGDATQDARDRYDRLLAYVGLRNGPQLNRTQVGRGWAKVYVFDGTPFRQVDNFRSAARSAKRQGRGVWGQCGGDFHRDAGR